MLVCRDLYARNDTKVVEINIELATKAQLIAQWSIAGAEFEIEMVRTQKNVFPAYKERATNAV